MAHLAAARFAAPIVAQNPQLATQFMGMPQGMGNFAGNQQQQPITSTERDKQIKIIGYLTGGIVLLLLFVFVIGKLEFLSGKKNNFIQNKVIPQRNTALQSIASQHGYM